MPYVNKRSALIARKSLFSNYSHYIFGLLAAPLLGLPIVGHAQDDVSRFFVVDATTDTIVGDFGSGTTLALSELGEINIVALTDPKQVGSVVFDLNGEQYSIDNTSPYSLGEDIAGDYLPLGLEPGTYVLNATPYSQAGGEGIAGESLQKTFTIDGTVGAISDFEAEAESEAGVEAEAEVAPHVAAGATALAAAAAASGNNAVAVTAISGSQSLTSISAGGETPAQNGTAAKAQDSIFSADNLQALNTPSADSAVTVISAEAEAETEMESEAEAEVGRGSAVAVGGSAGGAAAVGTSIFLFDDGSSQQVAGDTMADVEVGTSTSTSVSDNFLPLNPVNELGTMDFLEMNFSDELVMFAEPDQNKVDMNSKPNKGQKPPKDKSDPVLQLDAEIEVESESEAEAEAETDPGAAAAVATGGSAVAVAGDFAATDTGLSVASSASTSPVTTAVPAIFSEQAIARASSVLIDRVAKAASTPITSKGLFEAEAEAEAEAETEAQVDNNAAAVATVASGGGGAGGLAATARVAASTTASTSTETDRGQQTRRNDVTDSTFNRFVGTTDFLGTEAEAEAKAETEAEADIIDGVLPVTSIDGAALGMGDAAAESVVLLEGSHSSLPDGNISGTTAIAERSVKNDKPNKRRKDSKGGDVIAGPGNLEVEVETEVEVEAEVEIGFNAAAAGASAVAVQAENGFLPTPAEVASATSSSTSVFGNAENRFDHLHQPGPAADGERGGVPVPDVDTALLVFEVETEAEAEAEVGINAAAAAAAASGAGSPGMQADSMLATTPFAAASASAAGAELELIVTVPADDQAGTVYAYARATDPECQGVAVAVAVAGVPTTASIDNESEQEAEGLCEATVEVTVFTNPIDALNPLLVDIATTPGSGESGTPVSQGSSLESESEAEAEAEAEAGYGVAAAAAGAASAGLYSKASSKSETSTLPYEGSYDF